MTCKELTLNGLKYQDEETGENKNIPRFEDDSGYKYSDKDKEIKDTELPDVQRELIIKSMENQKSRGK